MPYYIYIISNGKTKPLYIGVTSNLEKRIWEHKLKIYPQSFSARYNLVKLLHWEEFGEVVDAINREKQLKHWLYDYKIELIKTKNPRMCDLSLLPYFLDSQSS